MAKKKKSRIPAPPRPVQAQRRGVQAPQRRVEHRDERTTRVWFLALGAAILIAAAAVGIAMAFRGGDGSSETSGQDGPCLLQTFPPQGHQHVQQLSASFQYSSFPPTSGPHYPIPAVYNIYDQPVPEIRVVHNLEHGAIVVQYGSKVPPATVQKIAAWYAESPLGMVVAPLPPLGDIQAKAPANADTKIFLTAWTHLATCSTFDEGAFTRFRDDFRAKGPENQGPNGFRLEDLQPGGT